MKYIFISERLGFRNWEIADVDAMTQINLDEAVMEFFPSTLSKEQTADFIIRMSNQFAKNGFCYFAVDKLIDNELIGFIGISEQSYAAPFTPCIDIGWRIKSNEWNKGYATEGAKRCLEFAFTELKLKEIFAIAPTVNKKSESIMLKIGMQKQYEFVHPLLAQNEHLKNCILYKIDASYQTKL